MKANHHHRKWTSYFRFRDFFRFHCSSCSLWIFDDWIHSPMIHRDLAKASHCSTVLSVNFMGFHTTFLIFLLRSRNHCPQQHSLSSAEDVCTQIEVCPFERLLSLSTELECHIRSSTSRMMSTKKEGDALKFCRSHKITRKWHAVSFKEFEWTLDIYKPSLASPVPPSFYFVQWWRIFSEATSIGNAIR